MNWSVYAAFLGFALVVIMIPGPDFVVVVQNTLSGSRKRGISTALGVASSCILQGVAAATGLGTLIVRSQPIFDTIKWIGVVYLAFLGIQALRSARYGVYLPTIDSFAGSSFSIFGGWRRGFLSNVTNPKVLVFYLAVLPQFLVPGMGVSWLLALALSHALLGFLYLLLLVFVVNHARRLIALKGVRQLFSVVSGAVLLGFSICLALENS